MSKQQPLGSPFNAFSTAAEVVADIDLHGVSAIVTGGYSGLGLETARALLSAGAEVIVPARDRIKAERNLQELDRVKVVDMDLNDPRSIARFGAEVVASGTPISMLVCSAGVMATDLYRDADGHEGQFSTNHLGHFRLVSALWPALVRGQGARVISVSSRAHQLSGIDFDDIDFLQREYDRWIAYAQSKTANILFARELDRRGQEAGVRAFSLHPGQILTDLARHLSPEDIARFDAHDENGNLRIDPASGRKTPQQGAATAVWAATSPLLAEIGGVYLEDCDVAGPHEGELGRSGVASWGTDDVAAERLWSISTLMAGVAPGKEQRNA